jgi:hypothetical protein
MVLGANSHRGTRTYDEDMTVDRRDERQLDALDPLVWRKVEWSD